MIEKRKNNIKSKSIKKTKRKYYSWKNTLKRDMSFVEEAINKKNDDKLDYVLLLVKNAWLSQGKEFAKYLYLIYTGEFFSWRRNDLCICGSGKQIFNCHLKEIDNKIDFTNYKFKNIDAMSKKLNIECNIEGCKKNAIKSHIVPRSIIKRIDNKLNKTKVLDKRKKEVKGNREISFIYYCSEHDSKIYSKVDNAPFELNKKNVSLYATKASISEHSVKFLSLENTKKLCIENPEFLAHPILINKLKEEPLGIRDIKENIKDMKSKNGRCYFIEIEAEQKFFGWSFFNIKYDPWTGKTYNKTSQLEPKKYREQVYPSISMVCSPWKDDSIGIFISFPSFSELDEIWFKTISSVSNMLKFGIWCLAEGENFYNNNENNIIQKWINEKIIIKSSKEKNWRMHPNYQTNLINNDEYLKLIAENIKIRDHKIFN